MINLEDVKEIIVYSGVADLRKGISGLSTLVGDVPVARHPIPENLLVHAFGA